MNPNTSLFLSVNDFARATPWLHGPLALYAGYGLVVFAGLLVAGWWIARRDGNPTRMAAALWAPLGTLLAVAVNQPIVALVHEARPYETLTGILCLPLRQPTPDSPVTTQPWPARLRPGCSWSTASSALSQYWPLR